ncbi:hypothetical protein EH31_01355 [Erythrobacter longus]|uniref:Uncharacterized protein n=1 Tax=Erythrobacter longus TaxID=1044 RepID=A0A074MCY3_ERYLO|nr:hypothetical protein [Erythrobacter longus]KEO91339.1 hypothetical protein EH31_01355 [Erythrobacter longus]
MQAECAVHVLTVLYVAFDSDQNWADPKKIAGQLRAKGFGGRRVEHAFQLLVQLQMVDEKKFESGLVGYRISSYGIDWIEKCMPLAEKEGGNYSFDLPVFRTLKLVPPDQFYAQKGSRPAWSNSAVNWTKWGAVAALLALPTMIGLWWFS